MRPGDLVLMVDQNENRGLWNLALVEKVHESADGLVRSVTVKTKSSRRLDRPVNKLVLLEGSE